MLPKIYDYLSPVLPTDHSNQSHSKAMTASWLSKSKKKSLRVLDLGCGTGNSYDFFKKHKPDAEWIGMDIELSPEVLERTRTDASFVTYNGVNFPFADESFDLIYTHQVFEHVRYPEKVLAEAHRTLKPGGTMIGSTSQLEPYHSYSVFNYSFFGFAELLKSAGLKLVEMRPGIDSITLIQRSMAEDRSPFNRYFKEESPGNAAISKQYESRGHRFKNFQKLRYAGHIIFRAQKPE